MVAVNKDYEVLAFHLGLRGDLNENDEFLDKIELLRSTSNKNVCVEEYYFHVVVLYEVAGEHFIYFTKDNGETVDGYIIKSTSGSIATLYKVLAQVRGWECNDSDLLELVERGAEEGFTFPIEHLTSQK